MSTEADALQSIAALLALPISEDAARAIAAGLTSPQILQLFDRQAAISYARKLLDDGLERRSVVYRLAARYDISPKTAYRRITDALELGRPVFGTAQPGR
ncbi:MAG: hypothetical protein JWP93_2337 [Polaromonas sp.]|nr:hypothetical protein [Polaromonas sp.]